MSADANDPPTRTDVERERVKVGSYVLVVGDPEGMEIKAAAGQAAAGQAKSRPLEQAIAQADREPEPPRAGAAALEGAVEDAAQVTSKVELALSLFTQIVQGALDPSEIGGELEALLDLLARLDREERWKESLRLARALAKLLALVQRWLQLLQSLRAALRAAKRLQDVGGQAWALHEQGTLYLAAEKHAAAASLLSEAHDLRYRFADTHGLTITDHNLQVLCKTLRARLHEPSSESWLKRILQRPVFAVMLAVSLLVLGGAAGAAIRGASGSSRSSSASIGGPGTRSISGHTESTSATTGNTSTGPPVGKRSSISLECPSSPVPFGERVRVSGRLTPAQAEQTVSIVYTTPSRATKSEARKTQAGGAYQAVASADEPGEWRVASSWPGSAEYAAASRTCAFRVSQAERTEAVTITASPISKRVNAGQEASFSAAASGIPAPTVQWQESRDGGETFSAIAGATSTTLTLAGVTTSESGREYRAVFTNSSGSLPSGAATLTVSTPGGVAVE